MRVKNGDELATALVEIGRNVERKSLTPILQKLSMEGLRNLVRVSAKDTGFLRSRWSLSTGNAASKTVRGSARRRYSDASVRHASRVEWGDKVTLYNNTEYAEFLEQGTPNMRAQPMIKPTYFKLLAVAKRLSASVSRVRVS